MQSSVPNSIKSAPPIIRLIRRHAPFLEAAALLWLMVGCILISSLRMNGGVLTYARDDSYIHMAMAKTLALHHVWGVTRYAFVSSSSGPLWTALLAAIYSICGVSDKAPLVMSLLCATALLALVSALLRREGLSELQIFFTLFVLIFVMPLPYLVVDAMEHPLHTIATIAFLYLASSLLASNSNRRREAIALAALAPILVGARFEGLFLLSLTASLFAIRRRYFYALLLLALGALPVVALAIPSILHGGWILPNAVMLKGHHPSGNLIVSGIVLAVSAIINLDLDGSVRVIGALAAVALFFSVRRENLWRPAVIRLALFIGILLAHLAFAQIGDPFRYEAYLIATGIYVLASCLKEPWCEQLMERWRALSGRNAAAAAVVALLIAWPMLGRGFDALEEADRAQHNIFEQQYQMARFAREFYQGQTVALNDIGAVSYFADIKLIDLQGLASTKIARSGARSNPEMLAAIARREGARIAMVYPAWLPGIPPGWTRVGQWRLHDYTVSLGGREVEFWALDPSEVEPLRDHLREFSRKLPAQVVTRIDDPDGRADRVIDASTSR